MSFAFFCFVSAVFLVGLGYECSYIDVAFASTGTREALRLGSGGTASEGFLGGFAFWVTF